MKCSVMRHAIWVFTVCQSTRLEFCGLQRVKYANSWLLLLNGQVESSHASLIGMTRGVITVRHRPTALCILGFDYYSSHFGENMHSPALDDCPSGRTGPRF